MFHLSAMDLPAQHECLFDGISDLFLKGILTDITLIVRGHEFRAHRIVLVSGSTYFEKIILGNFSKDISIDMDPTVFLTVLKYIYGINDRIKLDLAKELDYFGVKGFDAKEYIKFAVISADEFNEFLSFVDNVYSSEYDDRIIDILASKITSKVNLDPLSDELLIRLLLSKSYRPENLIDCFQMVKELVDKGHSSALLTYFNFSDESFKGQIPHLGEIPDANFEYVNLMLISTPVDGKVTIQSSGYRWEGSYDDPIFNTLRIGDIIRFMKVLSSIHDRQVLFHYLELYKETKLYKITICREILCLA